MADDNEPDVAKRLLLDENAFLRRKLDELQELTGRYNWRAEEWERLDALTRELHGEHGYVPTAAAVNDMRALADLRRFLDPQARRSHQSVRSMVEQLIEERDQARSTVASELLKLVMEKTVG